MTLLEKVKANLILEHMAFVFAHRFQNGPQRVQLPLNSHRAVSRT